MKLILETDFRKIEIETTDHTDAGEMLEMFITAMIGVTFTKETVIEEMRCYIQEYDFETNTNTET